MPPDTSDLSQAPAPIEATAPPPAEAAFERAVAPQASLYALADAARECDGPYEAKEAGLPCVSLFAGELGDMLIDVAPHLIEFRRGTTFSRWWFEQWGRSVGVLIEAPATLMDLRRHFRTLLMVRDTKKKRYYFRFYDPRVLRVFLPSCTSEEARQFFGPIQAFYCESEGGAELLQFSLTPEGISIKRSPVPTPPR